MVEKKPAPESGAKAGMPVWAVIGGVVALLAVIFTIVSVYLAGGGDTQSNDWQKLASSGFGIAIMGAMLWFTGFSRSRK